STHSKYLITSSEIENHYGTNVSNESISGQIYVIWDADDRNDSLISNESNDIIFYVACSHNVFVSNKDIVQCEMMI
ncbi:unnamed protein product, partial [Schistosoma mattheei]